jgi:chromosome segregation ATPase
MTTKFKLVAIITFSFAFTLLSQAQAPATSSSHSAPTHKQTKRTATPSIETQIREMRQDLQHQIDALNEKLSAKDAQIEALQVQNQATQQAATTTADKVSTVDSALQQNSTAVNGLQASVTDLREKDVAVASSIQQVQQVRRSFRKTSMNPWLFTIRASLLHLVGS